MALHPLEGNCAPLHGAVDFLNELEVFDGFLIGLDPPALLPTGRPLGDHINRVLRVREDVEVFACQTGLSGCLKEFKDSIQFAQIVGTAGPTARIPTIR